MSGNIKGITIEFRGETTKLDAALRKINSEANKTQRELTSINKALKFNPTSVDLWRQKQQVLNEKIKQTEERQKTLKEALKKMDDSGISHESEEYRRFQRELIETESKLKVFKAQLREIGNVKLKALSEQFKKVGKTLTDAGGKLTRNVTAPIAAAYGASIKAAMNYGDSLAKVATIADQSQVPIKTLSNEILNLSNESGKGASELAEATYQALSASVETKNVSGFVRQATGLAKAGFLETADAVDVLTTVINAYGKSAEDADEIANMLIQTQNDGKTTVNELAQNMGQVIPTASALNIPLEQLAASYVMLTKQGINTANSTTQLRAMFNELSKDGSNVSKILKDQTGKSFGQLMQEGWSLGDVLKVLNESVDGNGEAFKNLWGNTRAGQGALALVNGGLEEFNEEAAKMLDSTGNVDKALSELATPGAAARKALNQLVNVGIQIGDVLAPYIEKASQALQWLVDKFNKLSPTAQKTIVIIGAIAAAIGPVLTIIGTLTSGIGSVIGLIGKVIPMISGLGSTVGLLSSGALLPIIAIIGLVVAAFILWKKKGDEIKAGFVNMKNSLVATFNDLKAKVASVFKAITTPITNAVNTIRNAINKIKSIVNNAHLKLPKFKLPHFKISGGKLPWGIGGKGTAPKISVDWYAEGGIFNKATLAGIGEAGPEAVVPLDTLWNKLDAIAAASTGSGSPTINIYAQQNQSPREIAEEVERVLVRMQKQRNMAYGGI